MGQWEGLISGNVVESIMNLANYLPEETFNTGILLESAQKLLVEGWNEDYTVSFPKSPRIPLANKDL